jgi:hypothetical protein
MTSFIITRPSYGSHFSVLYFNVKQLHEVDIISLFRNYFQYFALQDIIRVSTTIIQK